MGAIGDNLRSVAERVAAAAGRAGRSPDDVEIVLATKGRSIAEIDEAIRAGARVIGENRVQEAREKHPRLAGRVAMHMIGHLQRNKAREALALFSMIHSVDSLRLAAEIDRVAARAGRSVPMLLEVNVSGEGSKYGIAPDELPAAVAALGAMRFVQLEGLMAMTPLAADPGESRPLFAALRRLAEEADRLAVPGVRMRHLSMGMSQDFEVAVEEGATMVRVGSAVFGAAAARGG
ncbi:MAG: YggS family pyridoxal phosphate-dependent enzyme [bacterium]|nr:YggS family pyridoxal phosphate-dependent enzyme [bacterium]